ncbi:predicted protein [Sparassis crispa]|uniref:Transforming growth factor beta regulator 1 n=1 Tax=Sparassis crispa TaxID=139825 RepID=A0A401GSB5_9APHY|nr:predicted protein [Sparassis crispa]GBE85118.1 predicted protein [Sparassis crispa]
MSRPNRPSAPMGPPQDMVMGPPPLPVQVAQPDPQKPKESQDVAEKYRRLKRKYFELEEKHKESMLQLKTSGERNVKWRSERALLLDRIVELETNPTINRNAPIPMHPFSAYPRSMLSNRGQRNFVSNLRLAIEESQREDPDIDPLLVSRHIGPQARKRQEAEAKERQEEEAREARRAARRPRAAPQKGKDISTPMSFAPPHSPAPGGHIPSPPILVSSTGTRLRLKPPAPPSEEPGPSAPSSNAHGRSHHSSVGTHHAQRRSESPISPMQSPHDDYGIPPGSNTIPFRTSPPPNQPQIQMTLRNAPGPAPSARPSDIQRHAKPKRLKAHTVTTKSFSIPMVPRDKKGKPLLPLNVGIMTVLHLGEVCMREHFHTERYIFPVGYEVTRRYLSTTDPAAEVVYHCTILDGGDGPKFQIIASDMPDKPVIAGTATGAWSVIVRAANHVRNRQHSNSVSGPDFFGLGQNTIKHLIQELPNARQLKDYVWQHFVEGGHLGGRHAAVIPALPDDHDHENEQEEGTVGQGDGVGGGSGTVNQNGNGYKRVPSGKFFTHLEPQIVHVEGGDIAGRRPVLPAPPTMNNVTFHQEYVRPPERERRNSHTNIPAYDEYVHRSPIRADSPEPPPLRTVSVSPVMARDRSERQRERDRDQDMRERDHYVSPPHLPSHSHSHSSSQSSHHRSPYLPNAGGNGMEGGSTSRGFMPAPSPPPVPATFASIMNAYPAPPLASSPPAAPDHTEYTYTNGGGRRNGRANTRTFPPAEER